ncbi:putative viral A-type inclusion protein [Gregarina niphandrodes]|uniref:Viral A-type inclusion protein n=1 Tax=Gregarina niphandrodes TaxID=110365 RepID=A0A023BCP2_GRENI|nr:putative viral A-type inclusion protein [Gregarina niphandrodes]EZG84058.1 putative viral A-type inclusion protein [Gregarina niphandrodes]|eukprot:XP_011128876.1 putative viral A-type inclusion protein [Gregarina niphandrodes]
MSQRQRDTIVLAVRIFQALKTTEFSVLMEQVLRNTHQASDQQGGAGDTGTFVATDVDLLLVLELMAMQAVASLEYAHTMEKEKKNAVLERDSLERDINETLQSYQSLIHEIMSNQVDMETLNRHVSQTLSRSVRTSAGSIDLGSLSKHDPPRHDPSRQVNTADYKQLQSQLKESQAKSEAYLKEMEGHRIKLNELQRRLNEKDQQLQELLLNTSHHPAQEPVMNTQKVAQHLNDLNTVTIKDTDNFHDYDRMLNERAKEVDMLRGRVESLTRKCEELTADRDFINKKMTALQAKQRTEGTSPSRQLETMTTIRNKELEMYKANVDELQTKLDRTNREMETIIGRESKLRKECQRLKTELDERTFTKMNQTAFKHGHEQTVLDMDTAGGTALLMQTTTQTAPVDKCLREKDETIRTLQAEADKTKTQNMILTTQNNELKIENKRLNDEVQSLQEKLRKALSSK